MTYSLVGSVAGSDEFIKNNGAFGCVSVTGHADSSFSSTFLRAVANISVEPVDDAIGGLNVKFFLGDRFKTVGVWGEVNGLKLTANAQKVNSFFLILS